MAKAQQYEDFNPIRIWYSYLSESKYFCQQFSTQLLRQKLGKPTITPADVLGHSLFASEESLGHGEDIYAHGTPVWHAMANLARTNFSFRKYLRSQRINPVDPVSDRVQKRDKCLRKIKPIVLLRETFRASDKSRTRKRPTLYSGEEAIYAMSDGNPRLLAGLLNDLLNARSNKPGRGLRLLSASTQAKVLRAASERMIAYVRTYPARATLAESPVSLELHLSKVIEELGRYFQAQLLSGSFNADPKGSFVVDDQIPRELVREIERGLLIGALIAVSDPDVVPTSIVGCRLRLSFMLAPHYRLLLRNLRQVSLRSVLNLPGNNAEQESFEFNI